MRFGDIQIGKYLLVKYGSNAGRIGYVSSMIFQPYITGDFDLSFALNERGTCQFLQSFGISCGVFNQTGPLDVDFKDVEPFGGGLPSAKTVGPAPYPPSSPAAGPDWNCPCGATKLHADEKSCWRCGGKRP